MKERLSSKNLVFCKISKTLFALSAATGIVGLVSYLLFEPTSLLGNVLQSIAVVLATVASLRLYLFERKLGGEVFSNSLVLAIGLALTSVGYVSYGILEEILPEMPSVGISDLFWISGYLLVTFFLIREFVPLFDAVSGGNSPLKRGLVFLGMAALAFSILGFLVPDLSVSDWDWLSKAAVASYVVFDAIILAMVLGLSAYTRGGLFFKVNLFLLSGFLIISIADIFYYGEVINGGYSTGHLYDLGWIFGYIIICLAKTFKLRVLKST